jgi:hypothetical protein
MGAIRNPEAGLHGGAEDASRRSRGYSAGSPLTHFTSMWRHSLCIGGGSKGEQRRGARGHRCLSLAGFGATTVGAGTAQQVVDLYTLARGCRST